MIDLHPDTIVTLRNFFTWNSIKFSDRYTRYGKQLSYTCLAFCTDLEYFNLVKMFMESLEYAIVNKLNVEIVKKQFCQLLTIIERTSEDPDHIFPAKSSYHTIYYFPEIHLED